MVRPDEAAADVSSRQALETLRHEGGGPPFERNGRRVRYRRADLDEWLGSRRAGKHAERNEAIRAAHAKGLSYSEIGRELGITRQRAQAIVAKGSS